MTTPPIGIDAASVSRDLASPEGEEVEFVVAIFAFESSNVSLRIP